MEHSNGVLDSKCCEEYSGDSQFEGLDNSDNWSNGTVEWFLFLRSHFTQCLHTNDSGEKRNSRKMECYEGSRIYSNV